MFYYLSFCDVTKPAGTQFLGATCVEAADPGAAIARASALGINPGGEVAITALEGLRSVKQMPAEGQKYFETFVPREVVMGEIGDADVEPTAMVCQKHNPIAG